MAIVIEKEAAAAADENGMCTVRALIDGVRDNGVTHRKGEEFLMDKSLVAAHVLSGRPGPDGKPRPQVELVGDNGKTVHGLHELHEGQKQQGTPRDKQQRTPKDK